MPSAIEFLLAESQAYKTVLSKLSVHEKSKPVPIHTAKQFNALLERIRWRRPIPLHTFPCPILGGQSPSARLNQLTSINYTDLEISVEIVLGVLALLKAGH